MPFDASSGRVAGLASGRSRKLRPPRKGPRGQVLELKAVALRDATASETPVGVRASLMRAYVDLHEIEMAITGTGKPKPVEARNATPRAKTRKPVAPLALPPRVPKPEPPVSP